MAQGDFTLFEEFALALGDEVHDFAADTFKLGVITSGAVPTAADATPTWSDYSANEVSAAGNYVTSGVTLVATSWSEAAGVGKFDADDYTISQSTLGFTDAGFAILYNESAPTDEAIGFIDMGGPVSERDGDITFTWNSSGLFTVTIS